MRKPRRPVSLAAVKQTKQQTQLETLTELETLRLRAEVARVNELRATLAHLTLQQQTAARALAQQEAKIAAMRDDVLKQHGFEPNELPRLEISDAGELITISRKAI